MYTQYDNTVKDDLTRIKRWYQKEKSWSVSRKPHLIVVQKISFIETKVGEIEGFLCLSSEVEVRIIEMRNSHIF